MYLAVLIGYVLLLAVAGWRLAPGGRDFDGYFFRHRNVGPFLLFATLTASWFGAASVVVTVTAAHDTGFSAVWLVGVPTLTTLLLFILLNRRIRRIHFVSLPQFFRDYYGTYVGALASFLVFLYMVVLAASQFAAWGEFVSNFLGLDFWITVLLGVGLVVGYSFVSGYVSVVLTDALQLVLISVSLIYMLIFLLPGRVDFNPGDLNIFADLPRHILMTVSFTLAWFISPIVWQRVASARSDRASRQGLVMAMACVAVLFFIVLNVGILSRHPGQDKFFFGLLVKEGLPVWGSLLVFLGVTAAIMSTADTALNLASLSLVNDILKVKKKQARIFWLATALSGIGAAVVVLRLRSIIGILGLSSEIMAEAFFIPGVAALFFRIKSRSAGILAVTLGGGFALLSFASGSGLRLGIPTWPYSLPWGLLLSAGGFILGLVWDKLKRSKKKIKI